jgi:hypothetical protein
MDDISEETRFEKPGQNGIPAKDPYIVGRRWALSS